MSDRHLLVDTSEKIVDAGTPAGGRAQLEAAGDMERAQIVQP